jgi:isopentenyl-diphosphate delta-isomerase
MEHVILVDPEDNAIGTMEKMEAHRKGLLHRAFSVMLYSSKGDMLLQKRAQTKYHSGGLWTNACCSHPLPDETMDDAIRRKLKQEMGIDLETKYTYKFIYRTNLDRGLIEHECDHVFTGVFDGEPVINTSEVEDWKFVSPGRLLADVRMNPQNYTHWFKLILNQSHRARKI